jgi:hypothetical protein
MKVSGASSLGRTPLTPTGYEARPDELRSPFGSRGEDKHFVLLPGIELGFLSRQPLLLWLYPLHFRDSFVNIATSYGLEDRGVGVRIPIRSRIFFTSPRPALRSTQPPIQWVPVAHSLWVKRPGSEAHQSPRSRKHGSTSMYPLSHTPPCVVLS